MPGKTITFKSVFPSYVFDFPALTILIVFLFFNPHSSFGAQSAPDTVLAHGTVVFQGKPVSGADIYRIREREHKSLFEKIYSTAEDGSFTVPVELPYGSVAAGLHLAVLHPDYAVGFFTPGSYLRMDSLTIQLQTPVKTAGRVVDTEGKPISGAEVSLNSFFQTEAPSESRDMSNLAALPGGKVMTDIQGRFVYKNLPERANISFTVTAPGYASRTRRGSTGKDDLTVILEGDCQITGQITFEDGAPAPGVQVHAISHEGGGRAETDERGFYTLNHLSGGAYLVSIWHTQDITDGWTFQPKENVGVDRGKTTTHVDFRLVRGVMVKGRVIDRESGYPLKDIWVNASYNVRSKISPQSLVQIASCKTDSAGFYALHTVPGEIDVTAIPPRFTYKHEYKPRKVIILAGEPQKGIDFQLSKGIEIKGVVRLPDGKPATGVIVTVHNDWHDFFYTDKEGRFTLSGVSPEGKITIHARTQNWGLEGFATCEGKPGTEVGINLREQEQKENVQNKIPKEGRYSLEGTVFGQDNRPLSEVQIRTTTPQGIEIKTVTDRNGHYRLDHLASKIVDIAMDRYNYHYFTFWKVPAGRKDFKLNVFHRFISGRVLNDEGSPVTEAKVIVEQSDRGRPPAETETDQEGYFRLYNLSGKTETVVVSHPDYEEMTFKKIKTNRENVRLVLKKQKK
ncbi:MAG: carboxypeptidase-like regulatory domain-containing protein [Candidatus Latescibacterota bacterium]